MGPRPGSRWRSANGTTAIVVVRSSGEDVELECDGVPMVPLDAEGDAPSAGESAATDPPVLLGKRYEHADLGVEVLCTMAGTGPLTIRGEALTQKGAKPLPSSD